MKKIIISLFVLFVLCANNQSILAKDYSSYCSDKSASKTFGGTLSSISGISFLERRIIESQLTKAIKRETGAKFSASLDTFFALSPLTGSFKSLKVQGKDVNYNGVYFSDIKAQTICPYNEVLYKDNTLHLVQNSVFDYSATITQDDINKTLKESGTAKLIDKMNNDKTISSLIKIQNYNVAIKDNKLIFNYEVTPLPKNSNILSHLPINLSNFNLSFSSGLGVKDGKVELLDFGLNDKKLSYNFLLPIINKFNPTSFGFNLDKTSKAKNGNLKIDDVQIKDSKIILKGAVIVKADI